MCASMVKKIELCICTYHISSQSGSIGLEILLQGIMVFSSTYLPIKLSLPLIALGRFLNNQLMKLSKCGLGFFVDLVSSQNHNL